MSSINETVLLADVDSNGFEFYTLISLLTILAILGLIGNLIVLALYGQAKERAVAKLLIKLLAGLDILVCAILIPFTIGVEYVQYRLSTPACRAFWFITTTKIPLTSMMIGIIALDRFLCICYPFRKITTVRRVLGLVGVLTATVCLFASALAMCHVSTKTDIELPNGISYLQSETCIMRTKLFALTMPTGKTGNATTPSWLRENWLDTHCDSWLRYLNLSQFVVVFFWVVFCYTRVYSFTRKNRMRHVQSRRSTAKSSPANLAEKRAASQELRMATTFCLITVVYVISVLPGILMSAELVHYVSYAYYLCYLNNVVNPYIYFFMNQNFRETVLKVICPCRYQWQANDNSMVGSSHTGYGVNAATASTTAPSSSRPLISKESQF